MALGCALVGTFNMLKGESLIGDAVGHSTYPGIVLAFMLTLSRSPVLLNLGAVLAGFLAYLMIRSFAFKAKFKADTAMAIVLTGFFALGSALNAYTVSQERYRGVAQASLKNYLFGQAADMMKEDVWLIFASLVLVILLLILFYKELKISVFDPGYAGSIGFFPKRISNILLLMTMLLIAQGLKSVGVILISSLFIAPPLAARQWSNRLSVVLALSALFGVLGAACGTYVSSLASGLSTGPTIIVFLTFFAFLSMLLGPYGMIFSARRQKRMARSEAQSEARSEAQSERRPL